MNFKEKLLKRKAIAAKGEDICRRALAENRILTDVEALSVKAAMEEVESMDHDLKAAKSQMDAFDQLNAAGPVKAGGYNPANDSSSPWFGKDPGSKSFTGAKFLNLRMGHEAVKSAATTPSGRVGVKALVAEGTSVVPTTLDAGVVSEGRPAASVLDVIPVVEASPHYSYLRQTLRDDKAAVVAKGATKPTSRYGLERIDGRLHVVAHVSEAIDVFDLEDNSNLQTFLQSEMSAGLVDAIVGEVLNGTGVGESFTGLNTVSGTLVQAFAVDAFVSIRKALTMLETSGMEASGILMHPSDWEAIELTREDGATGGFLLSGGPVDVAARKLWGVPVAATSAVPIGTAWALSKGSATIRTDGQNIDLQWGLVADDFLKNQLRARAEIRADLAIERPAGIVKISLSA